MSAFFHQPTSPFKALIQRETQRMREEANQEAVEALELGLAFEDMEEDAGEEEEETFVENPQFEEALRTFAQIEQRPDVPPFFPPPTA